jgi:hypothetical protein
VIPLIHDIIDKVIIHDNNEVEVFACFKTVVEKVGYESESGDCWIAECGEEYPV